MKRIYEDLFDEIGARETKAADKLVSEIEEDEQREYPMPGRFDVLFKIKCVEQGYYKHIADIKEQIYDAADSFRFIEDISEILCQPDEVKLGWKIQDNFNGDYLMFAIKYRRNSATLRQCAKFVTRLFKICDRKLFLMVMNYKVLRPLSWSSPEHSSWYFGSHKTDFIMTDDNAKFVASKGAKTTTLTEEMYAQWYYLAEILYYPEDELIYPAVSDMLYMLKIAPAMFAEYLFKNSMSKNFDYRRDSELVWKYGRKYMDIDVKPLVQFALDEKRMNQKNAIQYVFFPQFIDNNGRKSSWFSACPDENDYSHDMGDIRSYIENLNDYILGGSGVFMIDAMFAFGGKTNSDLSLRFLMHLGFSNYSDGGAIREVGMVVAIHVFDEVPSTWKKAKSTYWEQYFIDLLNKSVFKDKHLPDNIMDEFRARQSEHTPF